LEHRAPKRVPLFEEENKTMPKKKKTALTREQKKALAEVKKLQKKLSKDLELGLKKVENVIASKFAHQPTFNCSPFQN
jgi:hypothetical protein